MRILIVDDQVFNLAVLEDLLAELKCDVVKAWNGEEALEQFKKSYQIHGL